MAIDLIEFPADDLAVRQQRHARLDLDRRRRLQEGSPDAPVGATLRVRTLDLNGVAGLTGGPYNPLLVDHRFVIWIRGDQS